VTLVGQGLTLPTLIRRLQLTEHPAVAETERQARLELTRAALDHLDTVDGSSQLDPKLAAARTIMQRVYQNQAGIAHLLEGLRKAGFE